MLPMHGRPLVEPGGRVHELDRAGRESAAGFGGGIVVCLDHAPRFDVRISQDLRQGVGGPHGNLAAEQVDDFPLAQVGRPRLSGRCFLLCPAVLERIDRVER